jgi:hypothetical protein
VMTLSIAERKQHLPNNANSSAPTTATSTDVEARIKRGIGRNVRQGSFCDISAGLAEVRFAPFSGRILRRCLTFALCHYRTLRAKTTRSQPLRRLGLGQ